MVGIKIWGSGVADAEIDLLCPPSQSRSRKAYQRGVERALLG